MFAMMPISLFILETPYFISSLTWIAMFSMLPLLKKDGLIYWYWVLNLLYYAVTSWIQPLNSMQYKQRYALDEASPSPPLHPIVGRWRLYAHHQSSEIIEEKEEQNAERRYEQRDKYPTDTLDGHAAPFHYAPLFWCYQPYTTMFIYFMTNIQWTDKYPDIGTYLIMIYCCAHFSFAWILFVLQYLLEYFGIFKENHVLLCNKVSNIGNMKKQKKS